MKKGRRKNHNWDFVRYKGDTCIYAKCKCGFTYSCCNYDKDYVFKLVPAVEKLYPYCPICGSKKTTYNDEVKYIERFRFE